MFIGIKMQANRESKKQTKLSVRLLKENITLDTIRSHFKNKDNLPLFDKLTEIGYLFNNPGKPPKWKNFLDLTEKEGEKKILTTSPSFLLFIEVSNRCFAYSFWYAYSEINYDWIEDNFGFIVSLSSINSEKIKHLTVGSPQDTKRNSTVSGKAISLNDFTLNKHIDIVKNISGTVKEEFSDWFKNPSGADSLTFTTYKSKYELDTLSKKLLECFLSEDYKKDVFFKDINNLKKASKNKSDELKNRLLENFRKKVLDDIFMVHKDFLSDDVNEYKYNNTPFHDFDFIKELNIEKIEDFNNKISIINNNGTEIAKWKAYDCLASEIKLEEIQYFLHDGIWYYIDDKDFLKEIDDCCNKHKMDIPNIFNACKNEKEEIYSKRIVEENIQKFVLMDKKLVTIQGKEKFEICDIYDKNDNIFYHLKMKSSSSGLSHLWNQGLVSLQSSNEDAYKIKFKELTGSEVNNISNKIYYGIIVDTKNPRLPYFSKITFFNLIKLLNRYDRNVEVKWFFIHTDK